MNEIMTLASTDHDSSAIFSFDLGFMDLEITSAITTSWGIMLVLILVSYFATRNMTKVPGKLQNAMEYIVGGLRSFFGGILGKDVDKYLPLIGTYFLFILISNYSGLLPFSGTLTGLAAPTSMLGVTVGLSLIVFFLIHFYGVKEKGLGYFKHFVSPFAFLLPLMILEELVRPLSLSLRLYGNVFGEETVAHQLFALVPFLGPLPIMLLSVLLCFIQAIVFTMLTAVFIDGATAKH